MPETISFLDPATPRKYWIAVASADHVACGVAGSFMQVCHGKAAPLRRIRSGDGVIYYSPTQTFGSKTPLQAFTALGEVLPGEVYQTRMDENFYPWRRDVRFMPNTRPAPIRPLIPKLAFINDPKHWGYQFRFGLFAISEDDFSRIAAAMYSAHSLLTCTGEP